MTTHRLLRRVGGAAALTLALGWPSGTRAESPTLPAGLEAALEANARGLEGLKIRGTRSRRIIGPAAATLAKMGTLEDETEFTQSVRFELRLGGTRLYESLRYPPGKYKPADGLDERSFDGEKIYSGSIDHSGPTKPAELLITAPAILAGEVKTAARRSSSFEMWYLAASGFVAPAAAEEIGRPMGSLPLIRIAAGKLESVAQDVSRPDGPIRIAVSYPDPWASSSSADPEKDTAFQGLRGESKGLQQRIERDRRQLRGRRWISEFTLDPTLGYAVTERRDTRENGAVLFHAIASDFRRAEPSGLWLPWRVEEQSHAYETRPKDESAETLYATEITLEAVERVAFGEDQFRVWYGRPGARVSDHTKPGMSPGRPYSYVVAAPLDEAEVRGTASWYRWGLIIGLNVLIAVIIVWASRGGSRTRSVALGKAARPTR